MEIGTNVLGRCLFSPLLGVQVSQFLKNLISFLCNFCFWVPFFTISSTFSTSFIRTVNSKLMKFLLSISFAIPFASNQAKSKMKLLCFPSWFPACKRSRRKFRNKRKENYLMEDCMIWCIFFFFMSDYVFLLISNLWEYKKIYMSTF